MNRSPIRRPPLRIIAALGLIVGAAMTMSTGPAQEPKQPPAKQAGEQQAKPSADPARPWRAFGRVTDKDGKPLASVTVTAHCGYGTLRPTGSAASGGDGRYEMDFGPGIWTRGGNGHQAATVAAHKAGFFEVNLNRQGGCTAAQIMPDDGQLKGWSAAKDRVFLPGKSIELNFVMRPAGRVSGKLVDEQGRPLARYAVSLNGADLPPSSSVVRTTYCDDQGRFTLDDIPTTFRYQFEVCKADPKPPWDDSWASAALRFETPDTGDLRAWFGSREVRVTDFVVKVAGPGVHGRTATAVAGNAGLLNLTAAPADVVERRDTLLTARSATLTLRNTPKEDAGESLAPEAVPADAAAPTQIRLARTRPSDAGAFVVSFENPRGLALEKGKHQVIVQVFVGGKPDVEPVLRHLDIQAGRYEVPVTAPPARLDDSRVSVTFVTVQPNHDEWIKAFFKEGRGMGYQGVWFAERGTLPAIPLVATGRR
jgi:hypothetical protein